MKTTASEFAKLTKYFLNIESANYLYYLYSDPRRYYHNIDHIVDGFTLISGLSDKVSCENWLVLNYAWLGHDLIYIPSCLKNEELSYTFFHKLILTSRNLSHRETDLIASSILATRHLDLTTNTVEQYICDVDLFGFVTGFDASNDIFKEYQAFDPDLTWENFKIGRHNFLENLLKTRNNVIFQSKEFSHLNFIAIKNIKKQIQTLTT